MKLSRIIAAWVVFFSPQAFAEDFEGIVRLVGSAYSATTTLTDASGKQAVNFCTDDESRRLSRLTGMTVKASGDWQEATKNKVRCVKLTAFEVLKASSGRDAVVGVLSQEGADFAVTTGDGSKRKLSRVPKGLRKMLGKKVIIDVKPMGSPSTKSESWKVVTYAPYP